MEQSVDIQPSVVKAMLDAGEDFLLIDVREPEITERVDKLGPNILPIQS